MFENSNRLERLGISGSVIDAITEISEFCKSNTCSTCPLTTGFGGCIYQNIAPAEVDQKKIEDLNASELPKVSISTTSDGTLGSLKCGDVVKIGNAGREYIVLEHLNGRTAVITKNFMTTMSYGDDGDYINSAVRKYCTEDAYSIISAEVGRDNILEHEVDLTSDDGSDRGNICCDYVSLLTTEQYRKYSDYLEPYGESWWTATRVSANKDGYARYVCYVFSDGVLSWCGCRCDYGVRPFCILKSSVLVS